MKIPGSYVEARAWRLARAGPRVRRLARLRPTNRNQRMKRNALMRMEVRENNAAKSPPEIFNYAVLVAAYRDHARYGVDNEIYEHDAKSYLQNLARPNNLLIANLLARYGARGPWNAIAYARATACGKYRAHAARASHTLNSVSPVAHTQRDRMPHIRTTHRQHIACPCAAHGRPPMYSIFSI